MNNKALLGLQALCRDALSLICVGLGLESRMPRNGARPVREGAVGFPSQEGAGHLHHKRRPSELTLSSVGKRASACGPRRAGDLGLRAEIDHTRVRNSSPSSKPGPAVSVG